MNKHKLPPLYSCINPEGRSFCTTSLKTVWWWENKPPSEESLPPPMEDKEDKELIKLLEERGYQCRKVS